MEFFMGFGCYLNGYGFRVGRKYLSLTRYRRAVEIMELTDSVIESLRAIKDNYPYNDVNRVREVMKLFGYYQEEEF